MSKKIKTVCSECEKIDSFIDIQDIRSAGWRITGWNINENEPICLCNKCEFRGVVRKARADEVVLKHNK